jgi:hypothetical protein
MHLLRALTGVLLFEAASGILAWILGGGLTARSLILVHTLVGICTIPYFHTYFVHIGYERDSLKLIRKLLGKLALLLAFVLAISGVALTWQAAAGPRISPWLHYTHLVTGVVLGIALLLHIIRSLDRLRLPDRTAPTPEMPGGRFAAYLGALAALAVVTAVVALALPPATTGPGAVRLLLSQFLTRAIEAGR